MSEDWQTFEQLDRMFRLDPEQMARLVEAGEIDIRAEPGEAGPLFRHSAVDVARHFPLRDKATLRRGAAREAFSMAALAAVVGAGVAEVQGLIDPIDKTDDSAADDAVWVTLTVPATMNRRIADYAEQEFSGNYVRLFGNLVGLGAARLDVLGYLLGRVELRAGREVGYRVRLTMQTGRRLSERLGELGLDADEFDALASVAFLTGFRQSAGG